MCSIELKVFPAKNGESIMIRCYGQQNTNILIDMGYKDTYKNFIKEELQSLGKRGEKLDLLILTHYDVDHIEGAIAFFEDLGENEYIDVREIWINDLVTLHKSKMDFDIELSDVKIIDKYYQCLTQKYRMCEDEILMSPITPREYITITKLITKLGYNERVNRSFKNKSVYVRDSENGNIVNINEHVSIRILGPTEINIHKMFLEFLKWIENSNIYSELTESEMYELFSINIDEEISDDVLETHQITSRKNYKEEIDKLLQINTDYKDKSIANKSSIAFMLEYEHNNLVFSGDTDSDSLIYSLNETQSCTLFKLSHHGSKNNTSRKLLKTIECNNYLICTDGSGNSKHPNKETIAYIAELKDKNLYINYELAESNFSKELQDFLKEEYKLNIVYGENGSMNLKITNGEVIWKSKN